MRITLCSKGISGVIGRLIRTPEPESNGSATFFDDTQVFPDGTGPRLLMIDVGIPRPDQDSGSLRAYMLMRLLRSVGYRIDFLPDDGADIGRYTIALQRLGIQVLIGPKTASRPYWFSRHHQIYDAVIVSRYHLAAYWIPTIRHISPAVRIIFDTVDLHFLRELREAEMHNNRPLMRAALVSRKRELRQVAKADVTWVVSPVEKRLLQEALPAARVEIVPNLHHIDDRAPSFSDRVGLLFVGGGRHPPNVDAVRWLLTEIYPAVSRQIPGCTLHIVGAGLIEATNDLSLPMGVHLHGHVPDLEPLLRTCRIGLAPLRFGAGVKGKVNQYMSYGMPTVATSCATEGMYLSSGIDVLVADGSTAFANEIVRLYQDSDLWITLSKNGTRNVLRHFSVNATLPAVEASFAGLGNRI